MRKQELIHLHRLHVEITRFLVDQGTVSAEIWTEYDRLDTNADSIHASKSDHAEAVQLLTSTLSVTLDQPTEEQLLM